MCGIAGIFNIKNRDLNSLDICTQMTQVQNHRGPDDSGAKTVSKMPDCTLGQTRLAIIDLSPAGHQPMHDPETGNWIVFNGEIYNFRELREELKTAGYAFHTSTDTEVILKAFNNWGKDCCSKLCGMFAFAIWNAAKNELFLARDRMGIKPLYFYEDSGIFIFASEVRAMLHSGLIKRKLDCNGLRSFLAYGSVQEPYTFVQNIRSLSPANFMTIASSGKYQCQCYWKPSLKTKFKNIDEVKQLTREKLEQAIQRRMIADVPLGAFLSGGIDSTAIVAVMQQASSLRVKTFSIVFDDTKLDEREYSRLAAKELGTDHLELELTGQEVKANLLTALNSFDQPSVDGLNTWFVSKLAKESGLTVALSGVGGDELFAGYDGFSKALLIERHASKLRKLPAFMGSAISSLALNEKMRKAGEMVNFTEHPYFLSRQLFSEIQTAALLNPNILEKSTNWFPENTRNLANEATELDPINRTSLLEMNTYMLSTLLRDTDQMSMAHALEVRVPLIDHELVELMLSVPGDMKLSSGTAKPLLLAGASEQVPKECIYRPKQGFTLPFKKWFAEELHNEMEEFFLTPGEQIFTRKYLKTIWQDYSCGRVTWGRIWSLFVVNNWITNNGISI